VNVVKEETLFFKGPSQRKCLLRCPDDHPTSKHSSPVIGFHGGGGSCDQFISLWDSVDERPVIARSLTETISFLVLHLSQFS
jgi:hypothetical protein